MIGFSAEETVFSQHYYNYDKQIIFMAPFLILRHSSLHRLIKHRQNQEIHFTIYFNKNLLFFNIILCYLIHK